MALIDDDVDVEVYITESVAPGYIEVYVPEDAKYECNADEMKLTRVNIRLQKDHGISRVGNMTIKLSNLDGRYSASDASSIFYGKRVVKDPIRIRSGWGPDFDTDIETQFQGMIKDLTEDEYRTATFTAYDTIKKLIDYTFDAAITVDSTTVPGMNPADIVEFLVKDTANIQFFDMELLSDVDLLDAASLAIAKEATNQYQILDTTIPLGSKLISALQDLMKIVNGYLYCGKDGKLHTYVYEPFTIPASSRSFEGSEVAATKQIIKSRKILDEDRVVNMANWAYNSAAGTTTKFVVSNAVSIGYYGEKTLDLDVLWNVNPNDLTATSERMFARYAEEIDTYISAISWLADGEAMKVNLGDVIELTDPAISETSKKVFVLSMAVELQEQITEFESEDAAAIDGKFAIACSEADEGDGKGVTADDFENWRERYAFAGNAEVGDPHNDGSNPGFDPSGNNNGVMEPDYGTPDSWGNGIEEIFIAW